MYPKLRIVIPKRYIIVYSLRFKRTGNSRAFDSLASQTKYR